MNTWPKGYRHAMTPSEHEQWNDLHYPGTRQLCCVCEEPTGRCEEDSIYVDDKGPLCELCFTDELDVLNQKGFLNFS